MKTIISTQDAPAAIGPYSQAVRFGNLMYTAGQIPLNPETGKVVAEDVESQTRQALDNLQAVVRAAGAELSQVIKTTVFLKDMNDFAAVNKIYGEYFSEQFPARSAVQVARLPLDVLVEVEAVVGLA